MELEQIVLGNLSFRRVQEMCAYLCVTENKRLLELQAARTDAYQECQKVGVMQEEINAVMLDADRLAKKMVRPTKYVAVIQDGYSRDTQVFYEDPEKLNTDLDWESYFKDTDLPCLFVGVFSGEDENLIRTEAAKNEGVHPGVITLIEV